MLSEFKEYIGYTEIEKKEIWNSATFVFDTNVLLNLYKYSRKSSDTLLKAIQSKNKIFLPYHVGEEFFSNRYKVINDIQKSYKDLEKKARSLAENCRNDLKSDEEDIKRLEKYIINWLKQDESRNVLVKSISEDYILNALDKIFVSNIGEKIQDEELEKLKKEARTRYQSKTPPGYEDNEKDSNSYGDFLIWKEILRYAQQNKSNIVFVMADMKKDWWETANDRKIIGVRHELLKEFRDTTKQDILIYNVKQFLQTEADMRSITIEDNVLIEVSKIKKKTYISNVFNPKNSKKANLHKLLKEEIEKNSTHDRILASTLTDIYMKAIFDSVEEKKED